MRGDDTPRTGRDAHPALGRRNRRKRAARAERRRELRNYVIERSGRLCEWPGNRIAPGAVLHFGEEMAHVHGTGMGGRASADEPGNVAWLCRTHHDLLDGRRNPADYEDDVALLDPWGPTLRTALAAYVAELRRRNGEST